MWLVVGGAFAVAVIALFWQRPLQKAWTAMGGQRAHSGTVRIFQFDYGYTPQDITWRTGDRVTIALRNQSPSHWHEMMIGRGADLTPTAFGPLPTQFDEDFWSGVRVTVSHAHMVDNIVLHNAIVTFQGPRPNVATGGNFSPTLQPGGGVDLTFTVPDKPGVWHYGCFVQQYIHYMDGMKGTITILPAVSPS